jgi:acyl-CoA hydrolase
MSETKRVKDTLTRLAQIMTPNEANVLGNVFGGAILAMIDLTASATAQKFAGTVCVTAAFERVDFHTPIEVGNLVTMEGTISYAGRTSVEVTIEVTATNLATGESRHSNTARVIMVAMRDGKPSVVPLLVCETRSEKIAFLAGRLRRELRQDRIRQLEGLEKRLTELPEDELDRLVADRDSVLLPQLTP